MLNIILNIGFILVEYFTIALFSWSVWGVLGLSPWKYIGVGIGTIVYAFLIIDEVKLLHKNITIFRALRAFLKKA